MSISPVGALQSVAANGATTRAVTTHAIGNLLLVSTLTTSPVQVTAVSGGNAIGWTRVAGPFTAQGDIQQIWAAVVANVGSGDPVVLSMTGGAGNSYTEIDVQEFTAGLGSATQWIAGAWGQLQNSSSTLATYPRLVPTAAGQLYFGHSVSAAANALHQGGVTSGYTFLTNAAGDGIAFNPNCSGGAQQPIATLTQSSQSATIAVLISVAGVTLGSVTLAGAGGFGAAATARTPLGLLSATFAGTSQLTAYPGVRPAPPPPGSELPPPGGGLPPGPPPRNDPTPAGLVLYGELAHLRTGDSALGYPLRTFVDAAAGHMLQQLDDLVRDTPDGPGWSQAVDTGRAPTYALPWLGQFIGVRADPSKSDAAQRAQIDAKAGFARGTLAAVLAAAESVLIPGQHATITERSPDPYHFTVTVATAAALVKTYADETATYPTYPLLAAAATNYNTFIPDTLAVKAAVQAAKPAGLLFVMVVAGQAPLVGTGALGLAPKALVSSSRSFAGAGSLSAAGQVVVDNATATLAGASVFDPGGLLVPTAATLAGAGALGANAQATQTDAATLAGAGSLAAAGTPSGYPQLVQSYYVPDTSSGTSALTTPSFTPAAGEVLVVKVYADDTPTTIGTISGGSLTWTTRANQTASSNAPGKLATAVVGSSPAAMTVSVAFGGSAGRRAMVVERWTNAALAASPAIGSSQSNTTCSQTVSTAQKNSVVSWMAADWNNVAPGTPTYRGAGNVQEGLYPNSSTMYFGYQPAPTQGTQTFGVSSPTGQKASMAGIEIQSLTP